MSTETMPNLQGAEPEATGANAFDGSGLGSDIANTAQSIKNGDGLGIGVGAVASGLDVLGMAADPLGSLAAAGVGWLIEHVSFLREPFDKLMGDPGAISAQAGTWTNISKELERLEQQYGSQLGGDINDWQGDAAKAYRGFGKELGEDIGSLSQGAEGVASAITVAGALVGTARGIVRDLISTFVGKMIERALLALASSWCSFGASVAAFIVDAVAEGGIVAGKCASKIAEVLQKLAGLLKKFKGLSQAIGKLATKFDGLAKSLGKGVGKMKAFEKGIPQAFENAGKRAAEKAAELTPKNAAKDALHEQFGVHEGGRPGHEYKLPPVAPVEVGRQTHEGVEHTHEHNEEAEEKAKETTEEQERESEGSEREGEPAGR